MDSGGDVRVLNIVADSAFAQVGAFADRKAYAESLGAASATHYGFVGQEFIRFLLNNEDGAREAIKKNLVIWNAVSARMLGTAPSLQASRVATRMGSLVAPAALAAEVLALPWGADLTFKFGVSATPPASAMFLAFAHLFDTWIGANGLAYSTQTAAIFQLLRAYYHGAPKGAFILCGASPSDVIPDDELLGLRPETVPTRGWKAMTGVVPHRDSYGHLKTVTGALEYVRFYLLMSWSRI